MRKRFEALLAQAERINAKKSARIFRLAIASLDYLGRRGRRATPGGGHGGAGSKPALKPVAKPAPESPARSLKKKD